MMMRKKRHRFEPANGEVPLVRGIELVHPSSTLSTRCFEVVGTVRANGLGRRDDQRCNVSDDADLALEV